MITSKISAEFQSFLSTNFQEPGTLSVTSTIGVNFIYKYAVLKRDLAMLNESYPEFIEQWPHRSNSYSRNIPIYLCKLIFQIKTGSVRQPLFIPIHTFRQQRKSTAKTIKSVRLPVKIVNFLINKWLSSRLLISVQGVALMGFRSSDL